MSAHSATAQNRSRGPAAAAVENTGHVVEVPIPADAQDTLQIGGDRYDLVQYHYPRAIGVRLGLPADRGYVSRAPVVRLHKVIAQFPFYNGYPNNNRPVQPLNGRVIRLRGGKHD